MLVIILTVAVTVVRKIAVVINTRVTAEYGLGSSKSYHIRSSVRSS